MKFFTLLKKELREMLNLTTIIGVVAALAVFLLLGQIMGSATSSDQDTVGTVHLIDEDGTALSQYCADILTQSGFEVLTDTPDTAESGELQYRPQGNYDLLVIPKGFEQTIQSGQPAQIGIYAKLNSLSMSGVFSSSASETAAQVISEAISTQLISQNINSDTQTDPAFLKNPVGVTNTTFIGDRSSNVNAAALIGFAMNQTMFVPLVAFILVVFASQMIASAIATEKGDKTLETLLCTPVSRLSVLAAKMCSAGLVSLIMAAVYMVGFSSYMGGLTGGLSGEASQSLNEALSELGVAMGPVDFLFVGLQLFLTILIALAISLILGALSNDVKSAQTAIAPLMIALVIPYVITMFADVNSLSLPLKLILYIIPFTHTFLASGNMIFDNFPLYFGGLAYQIVFLAVMMFFAVKLFSGDRIFTIRLNFGAKKRRKGEASAE